MIWLWKLVCVKERESENTSALRRAAAISLFTTQLQTHTVNTRLNGERTIEIAESGAHRI